LVLEDGPNCNENPKEAGGGEGPTPCKGVPPVRLPPVEDGSALVWEYSRDLFEPPPIDLDPLQVHHLKVWDTPLKSVNEHARAAKLAPTSHLNGFCIVGKKNPGGIKKREIRTVDASRILTNPDPAMNGLTLGRDRHKYQGEEDQPPP
jgi:hypothetical protein